MNQVGGAWQHDPVHRRGVPYRETSLRQQFGRMSAAPETRQAFRGHDPSTFQGRGTFNVRPSPPPGRANVPDGSRSDMRSAPSGGSSPPSRQTVPDAGRSMTPSAPSGGSSPPSRQTVPDSGRSMTPSAPSRPSAPSAASPPHFAPPSHVEPRSHAFEGVGRGGDVRSFSERGHASVAPRSSGGAPSSGGSHSSGSSSGNSQNSSGQSRR